MVTSGKHHCLPACYKTMTIATAECSNNWKILRTEANSSGSRYDQITYMMLDIILPSSQGSLVLHGLLHSSLWCGQSTTSSLCQASLPRCASTQSQLVWASGICCCRPNCLELTEPSFSEFQAVGPATANVWRPYELRLRDLMPSTDSFGRLQLKLGCFQSTSTYSALDVSHFMWYINSRLTQLLSPYIDMHAQIYLHAYVQHSVV